MFRILLKWASLQYFIWFLHSKLSKTQKKWKKKEFQKKPEKNFFFVFFKFFISDWIYTTEIMTKNLSHVIWSYRKKVCGMHILCILRHNFQKNCKKNFFCIFKIFHFWLDLYTQNHVQQFVSCLIFMIIYIKSMWNAHPSHTKAYKRHSL